MRVKVTGRLICLMLIMIAASLFGMAACQKQGPETASATPETNSPTARPTFTPVATATPTNTPKPTVRPSPTALVSPLTGLPVSDIKLIKRRVIAVRIGNDPAIRPQEGLGKADLVYEEIMDGWWDTRFTALFLESEAERIRPIRSARLSSIHIAKQYDAALVNTGASDEVRWRLSQTDIVNLDEYFHSTPYHILAGYDWRGRFYTSTDELREYMQSKKLETTTIVKSYVFDKKAPKGSSAVSVHIPYPQQCYVDWKYDAAAGLYLRWTADEPHLEGLTGEQISAANVVILYAEHKATDIIEDVTGATSIDIVLEGSGRAQIIRDGIVVEGTWKRNAEDEPILYYDKQGVVIPFKPGKTWIQIVPPDYEVVVR
ncbi:MAG: DUF3048 C-terminal domain-containing protein [Chloroflexi bacterium]|nr:DUF3048 C-terminal domain-containing protein [Chloroflexota bacterium]